VHTVGEIGFPFKKRKKKPVFYRIRFDVMPDVGVMQAHIGAVCAG
jgi:hypothetical protein